ncbi:2-amino-4-hydroxy-6-hydroxymethyldihydropteridine diphosphokinase [Marimonas lutisalis]|uniref:2-amino-4-hydroxy-6- hydroxymethyldihydropteridine diphosphokinase n=1 Tax=Marimonas lutisalis TaxID=2545756 RepID=UPI0010FA05D8
MSNVTRNQLCLLALGGNQETEAGPPAETLRAALRDLAVAGCEISAVSRFWNTPAFPAGSGPDFVNAAAVLRFDGTAADLLALLHRIEARHGRARTTRWGQRTLDLDLLAIGDLLLPDREIWQFWHDLPPDQQRNRAPEQLILPHPRLQDRAFVLVPLAEVAPDWVHPVLGRRVDEMLAALPPADIAAVRPLDDPATGRNS